MAPLTVQKIFSSFFVKGRSKLERARQKNPGYRKFRPIRFFDVEQITVGTVVFLSCCAKWYLSRVGKVMKEAMGC